MRVATLGSLRICRSEEIIQEKSLGATRVRTGVAVPGRVVGVEITKDEGRRRGRKGGRRERGGTDVSHGRANRRRVDV